jgi:hypothetical protein
MEAEAEAEAAADTVAGVKVANEEATRLTA